jgi:hypothetical protein
VLSFSLRSPLTKPPCAQLRWEGPQGSSGTARSQTLAALRRRVNSTARAINVRMLGQINQGVANVYPILTWVRLARRIPVCVHIDETPLSIVLAAGSPPLLRSNIAPGLRVRR